MAGSLVCHEFLAYLVLRQPRGRIVEATPDLHISSDEQEYPTARGTGAFRSRDNWEGIRGLVVSDESGQSRVYVICEPSTHYYQVMSRGSRWMPTLIDELIGLGHAARPGVQHTYPASLRTLKLCLPSAKLIPDLGGVRLPNALGVDCTAFQTEEAGQDEEPPAAKKRKGK